MNSAIASCPAARLLLNAVYRLLLNVSDVSLFLTRASCRSGITFSAAVHDCSSRISGRCLHFVHPACEVRTEADLHLPSASRPGSSEPVWNLHDFLQSGCSEHLPLRFRIFRTFTRHRICSFCTTGTSAILSVNFHSFLCLLRCWHLHEDFRNFQSKNRI